MTQRANPSVNRPVEAFKSAGAIALAGGTETGWISPSDSTSDISIQDRAIDDESLNAFEQNSQSNSFDITIEPGEAFVFGSWIVKDDNTVLSLAPNTSGQTVYVGWNNNTANDVIIGPTDSFNNGPNDTDQRIPLYEFDTDSNGVSNVNDLRQIGKVLEPTQVNIAEQLGLPSYEDPLNAPQSAGNAIYVDGEGSDLAGIYIHRGGSYKRVRNTDDEIEDLVAGLLTSSGGINLTYDDTSGTLEIDGATQYTDSLSRDAVFPYIFGENSITVTTTQAPDDTDAITIDVADSSITTSEIDEGISPTWSGNHAFDNPITQNSGPSSDSDVATKSYVDSTDEGLDIKESSTAATTENIDLTSTSDPNPIDGVTLSDGDRVLLKEQSDAIENGIYDAVTATDPSTWTRSTDADEDTEVTNGLFTFVENGTENGSIGFIIINNNPTLGTDEINFTPFSDAGDVSAGTALTKSGDTISHSDTSSQSNVSSPDGSAITDLEFDDQGHTTSATTSDFDQRYVERSGDDITGTLTISGEIDASDAKEIVSATYSTLSNAESESISEGSIVYISDEESLYIQESTSLEQIAAFDTVKEWVNNNSSVPEADIAKGFETRDNYPSDPSSGRVVFRTDKT